MRVGTRGKMAGGHDPGCTPIVVSRACVGLRMGRGDKACPKGARLQTDAAPDSATGLLAPVLVATEEAVSGGGGSLSPRVCRSTVDLPLGDHRGASFEGSVRVRREPTFARARSDGALVYDALLRAHLVRSDVETLPSCRVRQPSSASDRGTPAPPCARRDSGHRLQAKAGHADAPTALPGSRRWSPRARWSS